MAVVTALRKPKAAPTIGSLINLMAINKKDREELNKLEASLKEVYTDLETQLMGLLDQQQTTEGAGTNYSASIKSNTTFSAPNDGWNIFMEKVVAKNKLWHLVQRRVSDPAMRELVEIKGWSDEQMGKLGIKKFTKRSISLTKL